MNENVPIDPGRGLAFQRYEALMAHLRGDQEIFWERFGFMLVAEVIILGFFFNLFIEAIKDPNLAKSPFAIAALLVLCLVGIIIVLLFDRLYHITAWWIDRWLTTLKSIEPMVFENVEVFRNVTAPGSARQSARHIVILCGLLWAILGLAVVWRAIA
jgi:hypothetical protein